MFLGTVKIHLEVMKLASGGVTRNMAAKPFKKIQCVNIVRVTYHPQSNAPSGKQKDEIMKIKKDIQNTNSEAKIIANIYNILSPIMPSNGSALKVHLKDSLTQTAKSQILTPSVNKSINSSFSTDNRSTLSGPTSSGSSDVAAQNVTVSTTTNSVGANFSNLADINTRSPQTGTNDPIALQKNIGRYRTCTLLHLRSPHAFLAFRRKPKWDDISHKTCQTLDNRCECNGSSELTIIKGYPMSQ